jgi:glycosyltransferase involved in cell wall biosynthesis
MKIVHITPHLGGGVGRAHAALCAVDPDVGDRHYVLLEAPRDLRHVEAIERSGAPVTIAPDRQLLHDLMGDADIVQFEWWNHPLTCAVLAAPLFLPAMRPVFWCHVSGVSAPFIPPGLIEAADRFVFTSPCSRLASTLRDLSEAAWSRTEVINSGFCHPEPGIRDTSDRRQSDIGYLGTVEFTKMSPAMMEVIDRLDNQDVAVDVWGEVGAASQVHDVVARMKHPGRFRLRGHSDDPLAALSQTSIFLYLLQRSHLGTAENALIEAMSLGCAPLVFNNPCELAIVRDGETGLVARSADHAVELLGWMLDHPEEVARLGRNAQAEVRRLKTPARSFAAFRSLWKSAMSQPKRIPVFTAALGLTPRDWYLALQGEMATVTGGTRAAQTASKGTLAHFEAYYPDLDLPPASQMPSRS